MNKLAGFAIAAAIALPLVAGAQTSTSTPRSHLNTVLEHLQSIQQKVLQLRENASTTASSSESINIPLQQAIQAIEKNIDAAANALSHRSATSTQMMAAHAPDLCLKLNTALGRGHGKFSDVMALQNFLSTHGFFTASSTGTFGPKTEQAVMHFQAANNLPPAGTVGPMTRAKIMQLSCGSATTTPPVMSTTTASST